MRCCKHIAFVAVLLIGVGQILQGQSDHSFTRFTKAKGLSSTDIYAVYQDQRGVMLVGTQAALDIFDGKRFLHFYPDSSNRLPQSPILSILKDGDGNLWLQSVDEVGIFDISRTVFHRVEVKPSDKENRAFQRLWMDSRKHLFLVQSSGILLYDKRKGVFADDDLPFQTPPHWKVQCIVEDSAFNSYWLGCEEGIALYDGRQKALFYSGHNPAHWPIFDNRHDFYQAGSLLVDQKHRLWINGWANTIVNFLKVFDPATGRLVDAKKLAHNEKGYFQVDGTFQMTNGSVWLYGINLLTSVQESAKTVVNHHSSRLEDYTCYFSHARQLFEDREHNLWITTDQGLYLLPSEAQHINTYFFDKPLDVEVNALLELSNKQLLVGTWGDGLHLFDSTLRPVAEHFFYDIRGKGELNQVWKILEHSKSHLIIVGCQKGWIIILDREHGKKSYLHPAVFGDCTIRTMLEDREGNLWFGTQFGRLIKCNFQKGNVTDSDFTLYGQFPGNIVDLLFDRQNRLWVASDGGGVLVCDPANGHVLQQYNHSGAKQFSLASNNVTGIQQYNDSTMFIEARQLFILNTRSGTLKRIDLKRKGLSPLIKLTCMDGDKNLWMFAAEGMAAAEEVLRYDQKKNSLSTLGADEGFEPLVNSANTCATLNDGRPVFGGTNYLLRFDPKKMFSAYPPPDVILSVFRLGNDLLRVDSLSKLQEIRLNYRQNTFYLYFASPSISQRNRITYYYKMDGLDTGWTKAEASAFVNYTALQPGHYIFKVRCENDDGLRSAHTTSYKIYIEPPFWNTWWFSVLLALATASLIYYVYRQRINKLLAVQKIRTRVARDLHDDVGATLTTIGILSEMARNKTSQNDAARTLLDKISDNCTRLMESMDDIVWSINPNNDSMQKIVARMREYAVTLMEAKGMEYKFQVDEAVYSISINMAVRRDIFLIFKETINNLTKHSGASFVNVRISRKDHHLFMAIQDNGLGFDLKNYKEGDGLINIRKRARLINASLRINSVIGQGTLVEVEVPTT